MVVVRSTGPLESDINFIGCKMFRFRNLATNVELHEVLLVDSWDTLKAFFYDDGSCFGLKHVSRDGGGSHHPIIANGVLVNKALMALWAIFLRGNQLATGKDLIASADSIFTCTKRITQVCVLVLVSKTGVQTIHVLILILCKVEFTAPR